MKRNTNKSEPFITVTYSSEYGTLEKRAHMTVYGMVKMMNDLDIYDGLNNKNIEDHVELSSRLVRCLFLSIAAQIGTAETARVFFTKAFDDAMECVLESFNPEVET